jgi:hypothetical protein
MCFDTQEKSVPCNKVKKTHNKSSKNTQSCSKTHKPETLSKLKD